jgi:hypothetical protein
MKKVRLTTLSCFVAILLYVTISCSQTSASRRTNDATPKPNQNKVSTVTETSINHWC